MTSKAGIRLPLRAYADPALGLLQAGRRTNMRISHVNVQLSADDINGWITELAPDLKLRITDIKEDGVHGQLKILMWNIDFLARPHCYREREEVAVEISAHKLVPIPAAIVQRSLQEAMKDAPQGVDVLRQILKVHLPSILHPLGIALKVEDFTCREGHVVLNVADCELAFLKGKLPVPGKMG
ncbi:hypothetical protein [Alicyclobacillus dauci]|uniref:Uncharacterized protein n=1 Tax=Alicyclobacillus dauci TaxID=1475485 RepID=A0ABY6Z299_9BACL|nr:hypothetical protein [Alicyclobacillus dauci]WAH37024.1 hypothetical protein NZD86_00100 [Alicyclobacillus dauci]